MHIPDGLMDPVIALTGWIEFLVVAAVALFLVRTRVKDKDLPRIAVLSAGVFVAQMLNFPIGGGTTGHLVGGALMAIMVGPVVAILGMTVILLIQGLMFGDGGMTAFGLNAVNMAVIAPLTGWGVYTLIKPIISRKDEKPFGPGTAIAVAAGAWASVFLAAAACAAELVVSYAISGGTYGIAATVSVPAMLGYHTVIAVGEAIITAGVLAYVWSISPGVFAREPVATTKAEGLRGILHLKTTQATIAVLIAFALALPLYFIYSAEGADGLEKTMSDAEVEEGGAVFSSPFSYGENYFAALFAGILGFVVTALAALGLLRILQGVKAAD
jgi:cobalt/nickel transport system permease protein